MNKKNQPGCKCCGCTGSICVTVRGCGNVLLSGAVLTVMQGGTTIGTCTSNGSGVCCVSITAAGTYTLIVTYPPDPRYGTYSHSVSATCTTNSFTVDMPPATGYECGSNVFGACAPSGLIIPTSDPILSDSTYGTGTIGGLRLIDCTLVPAAISVWHKTVTWDSAGTDCPLYGPVDVPMTYAMFCDSGSLYILVQSLYQDVGFSLHCPCASPGSCSDYECCQFLLTSFTGGLTPSLTFTLSSCPSPGFLFSSGATLTVSW